MKTKLTIKLALLLPIIVFADYVIMSVLGCISCLFGAGESYFCGTYCFIGKIVVLLSVVFFFSSILPEIKSMISKKHGETD